MSNEEWKNHQPRFTWNLVPGTDDRESEVSGCDWCNWASSDQSYGSAGFGAHLEELGAPDYIREYWSFWAPIVESSFGRLDRDQVARELFDYGRLMENASKVYSELADLSKPNTDPSYIISGAESRYCEHYAYELAEHAYYRDQDGHQEAARQMREVAEGWRPGIVEEVSRDMQLRAEYLKRTKNK